MRCWQGYLSGARCRLAYAQLMPLPLTVSCFSKIQIGFTFLVPAHPGGPGKRAVKRVCVCVRDPFCTTVPNNFVKIGKTFVEISQFLWFSRWRSPPFWIFKNWKFYRSIQCKGRVCVTVPNFTKISQTVAEIWRFNGLKNGGHSRSWICEIQTL